MKINSDELIDLHLHSSFSDGDLTPNELVDLAKSKGIRIISITDHDTLQGNYALYGKRKDIKIIPGIELSAHVNKGRMHILGYNIDIYHRALNDKMNELRTNSLNSVLSLIEQIKRDYGIVFSYDEIKSLVNANHNLGRPDLAKMFVKRGIVKVAQDAFDMYLNPAYDKIRAYSKGLPYEECIELILNSGGIPVLAHPNTLEVVDKELLKLIRDMVKCGLQGIEVYHSGHSVEETKQYLNIANQLNLLVSGGSDYHGVSVKPNVEMGTGINNNIKIKELSILKHIKR